MSDVVKKIEGSLIQYGKDSDRVYLMKLNPLKVSETIQAINKLVEKKQYTKIIAKTPSDFENIFKKNGFEKEAFIPNFYKGAQDCSFISRYVSNERRSSQDSVQIEEILNLAKSKEFVSEANLPEGLQFSIFTSDDLDNITSIYKKIFKAYPFPIFDKKYILQTMNDNVCYFGVKNKDEEIVSISSAEMDKENLNAEMTDFATLQEHRGQGLALFLLKQMEKYLIENGFKTAYTIARAVSPSMNITFAKNNYLYSGTLINNTNISSGIESMNVWYKELHL